MKTNGHMTSFLVGVSLLVVACQQVPFPKEDNTSLIPVNGALTFTASIDDDATRTFLDGTSVLWKAEESINVFYGPSDVGSCFVSTNTEASTTTTFTGTISAFTGVTEGGEPNSFWAVYPYNVEDSSLGSSVSAFLPIHQRGIAGNIPDKTLMMVAKSPGLSLSFKQVCSRLRLRISHSDITRIVVKGNNDEVIAGRATILMDENGDPIWTSTNDVGATEIEFVPAQGSYFEAGSEYYLVLYPQTFTDGISIRYYRDVVYGTHAFEESIQFVRTGRNTFNSNEVTLWIDSPEPDNINIPTFSSTGWIGEVGDEVTLKVRLSGPKDFGFDREMYYHTIDLNTFEMHEGGWIWNDNNWENTYTLKALAPTPSSTKFIFFYGDPATVSFNDLAGTTVCYAELPVSILEHGEEIDFADPVTEAICLANYDRNGDGVLTINEAADVATLLVDGESPFMRPDGADALPKMTSFDELRYFTGLTEIPDYAFYRQFSLASIILPEDITSIGIRAFFMNPVLSTIEIPDGVETIGDFAFGVCNSLQEVTIPASVYVIGNRAFYSCGNLSSVTFEEGNLNTIGDGAFSWSQLAWIEIPDSVTSFGTSVFEHSTVGHVRLPSSLKKLPESTFYCAKVYEIVHSGWNQITEIGDYAFGAYSTSYGVTVPRALPTGLKTIGNRAFQYATLPAEFTLPKSLIKIGDYAFRYCSTLTKVELPATLATIGYGAFSQCPLEEIKVRRTTPASITQLESGTLGETFGTLPDLNGVILVPYDREASYKSSWATWADYIQNDLNTIPGGGNIGDDGDFGDGGDA